MTLRVPTRNRRKGDASTLSTQESTALQAKFPAMESYSIRQVARGTLRYHEVLAYSGFRTTVLLGVVPRAELQS